MNLVHYVPRPSYEAAQADKHKILMASCGERLMDAFSCTPRLVTCPACQRTLVAEERPR